MERQKRSSRVETTGLATLLPLVDDRFEQVQRQVLEHCFVRRREDDRRRTTGILGFEPPPETQTPPVARFETREIEVRPGHDEVVPLSPAEFEEFLGHDRTHLVPARVSVSMPAVTVPGVARSRVV